MSRGFVREGDQEETVIVPPRAALPDHAINYVTPKGMELLLEEKATLENERASIVTENETERRRKSNFLLARLNLLLERISSARIINPADQPQDEVRFGAKVTFSSGTGKAETFQIVGVDEADIKQRKIAFVAPVAKALMGGKEGDKVTFTLGSEKRTLTIHKIKYN